MRITHARVALELHELAHRSGPALLLLHALYGSSEDWGEAPAAWPGSVYALDFSGHGRSGWIVGGGYYPEFLVADADAALARIGRAAVAGTGLGAYVALLLAGTRSDLIPAALLLPGSGLAGGGAWPDFDREFPGPELFMRSAPAHSAFDPLVGALDQYVRPVDYAEAFARAARRLLLAEDATEVPPWWEAARRSAAAQQVPTDLRFALAELAGTIGAT
ncbi:MAG: alpha/beta fold hydrolase [Candidatus Binatia bacterium]